MKKIEKLDLPMKMPVGEAILIIQETLNEVIAAVNLIAPKATEYPEDFIRFYNLYPRKCQKKDAYSAWLAMGDDLPPIEDLEQFVKNYTKSTRDREPRYIPHASTWLRREGWTEDEAQRVRPRNPVMTPVAEMGGLCPNPELMISQQAPEWAYHHRWQDYIKAINSGSTALVFDEWIAHVENLEGLFNE